MKIAYIVIGAAESGVLKKIQDKIAYLSRLENVTVELHHVVDAKGIWVRIANRLDVLPFFWRFSVYFRQVSVFRALRAFVNSRTLDALIIRYPFADFNLWMFVASCKAKIIFEHNSLELDELRLRRTNSRYYRYFYFNERLFGPAVRRRASSMITVTEEIAHRQMHLTKGTVPVSVISNGIDVYRLPVRMGKPFREGEVLRLLFLAGSPASWHGLDLLLQSIKPEHMIHCTIAGKVSGEVMELMKGSPNVVYHPSLQGEELDHEVDRCHLGVGSLALFRNNMNEACTLKVREYWARGLPFFLGYTDTDLAAHESMKAFYLRVEVDASKTSIDIDQVLRFAAKVYSIQDLHTKIRHEAHRAIDYTIKAEQYQRCLNSVLLED